MDNLQHELSLYNFDGPWRNYSRNTTHGTHDSRNSKMLLQDEFEGSIEKSVNSIDNMENELASINHNTELGAIAKSVHE